MNELIENTRQFVKKHMPLEATGHDWYHVFRVAHHAKQIALTEGGDELIIELGSLLHDIKDWKFSDQGDNGAAFAHDFLIQHQCPRPVAASVCDIIETISFKGANVSNAMNSLEGKIVQDADRLDALGPIGLARAFSYGGFKGQAFYDPELAPNLHDSFASYQISKTSTINHFYEKLLLLKDRMHTDTAKKMAEPLHDYLEQFLNQFFQQWDPSKQVKVTS